jgi:hypothetical protein
LETEIEFEPVVAEAAISDLVRVGMKEPIIYLDSSAVIKR